MALGAVIHISRCSRRYRGCKYGVCRSPLPLPPPHTHHTHTPTHTPPHSTSTRAYLACACGVAPCPPGFSRRSTDTAITCTAPRPPHFAASVCTPWLCRAGCAPWQGPRVPCCTVLFTAARATRWAGRHAHGARRPRGVLVRSCSTCVRMLWRWLLLYALPLRSYPHTHTPPHSTPSHTHNTHTHRGLLLAGWSHDPRGPHVRVR